MEFLIFIALAVIAVVLFLIQQKLEDIRRILERSMIKGDVVSKQEDETSPPNGGGPK